MFIFAADAHFRFCTFATCPDAKFDTISAFEKLVQRAVEYSDLMESPVPIVLGGDIWDSTHVHPDLLKKVQDILEANPVPIYYINGNHDSITPSWTSFLPNAVHLGKEVTVLPDGTRMVGLDYVHPKNVAEALKDYPRDVDFLITHQFVENDVNPMIASSVPLDAYKGFQTVLAGDIHQELDVINNETDLHYPGPLSRCSIREPESCYMLISKGVSNLVSYRQLGNGYYYVRNFIPVRRMFIEVDNGKDWCFDIKRLKEMVKGIYPPPYLVLISDGFTSEDVKRIQKALDKVAHPLFRRVLTENTADVSLPEHYHEKGNSSAKDYAVQILRELDLDDQVRELAEAAIQDTDKFFEDLQETFDIRKDEA